MTGTEVPVEAYTHGYTHDITHRTIRIGRRRQIQRRLWRGLAICAATAIAIVVVILILNAVKEQRGDIPWF